MSMGIKQFATDIQLTAKPGLQKTPGFPIQCFFHHATEL